MNVSESINIAAPIEKVWATLIDIEGYATCMSSVLSIEVLEKPANSLIGFKWKETRNFMGSESSEIMWITESKTNEFFVARAESHGAVYLSRRQLLQSGESTQLSINFSGQPQTLMAKCLAFLMSPMIRNSLRKAISDDLREIKQHIESQA